MKLHGLLTVSLLSSAALLRAAPVDSHVASVTVYADRAQVTRAAAVAVAAGDNTLVFEHLPDGLDDRSLQFSASGTVASTVLDVNAQTVFAETAPVERVEDLEKQLRALKKLVRNLDGRAAILTDERDYVKRMLLAATNPAAPAGAAEGVREARPSVDEWQKLYGYSEETLGKIDAEMQSIEDQRDDLSAKRTVLEQELGSLRTPSEKRFKNVTVRVSAAAAGDLTVSLRYILAGAGWQPAYDARLNADDHTVELDYFGLVRNATGEDWKNVGLTLSTAHPGLGGGAPELRPWLVDILQPMPARLEEKAAFQNKAYAPNSALAGTRVRDDVEGVVDSASVVTQNFLLDTGAENAPVAGKYRGAQVDTAATSATFRVEAPVTILSDNSTQRVAVASAKLGADLRFEATPKRMEAAFLGASSTNTTEYPFLAGPMNTFLDGNFVAASYLRAVMPGEKFELQLGADEGISVKRRVVNRFSENTGLTGNGRRVTYEILVTVVNHKKTQEKFAFKEPMPVSRNEKIEVKLLSPEEGAVGTKDAPKEVTREEDGKLVWRFDLKPGEKREVTLKFSIDYPADTRVSGLE